MCTVFFFLKITKIRGPGFASQILALARALELRSVSTAQFGVTASHRGTKSQAKTAKQNVNIKSLDDHCISCQSTGRGELCDYKLVWWYCYPDLLDWHITSIIH